MDDQSTPPDPLIDKLKWFIRLSVRILAILMTFVILWGVVDVGWVLYQQLIDPPFMLLTSSEILATFGAFMAVLIAIEIFVNITVYLQDDVIHVKIVMATALMAIARKVIILDYEKISPDYVWATGGVVLALSIGYWLVAGFSESPKTKDVTGLKLPSSQFQSVNEAVQKQRRQVPTAQPTAAIKTSFSVPIEP